MSNGFVLSKDFPLLIIDSGLGGLLTFQALSEALPDVPLLYHGDSAYAPYGEKTKEFLSDRVLQILRFFATTHHIQGVVIACNTSASLVGPAIRQFCSERQLNCWTILEGASTVLQNLQYQHIQHAGVLATRGTIESGIYELMGKQCKVQVYSQACPKLVPLIESPTHSPADILSILETYMQSLLNQHHELTHVILGCTHYPLLQSLLEQQYSQISFLDPASILAEHIYITHSSFALQTSKSADRQIFISGNSPSFQQQMNTLLPRITLRPHTIQIEKNY